MTVSTVGAGVTRVGNGVTTVFSFPFESRNTTDIKVSNVVGTTLVPVATGFTVYVNSNGVGGTVTFAVPPANLQSFYLYRETEQTQLVSVSAQEKYDPSVVSGVWDKLTLLVQEIAAQTALAVKVTPGGDAATLLTSIFAAQSATASDAATASAARSAAEVAAAQAQAVQNTILKPKGQWLTATAYVLGDLVFQLGSQYECIAAHTSGTFATDFSGGKWRVFVSQGSTGVGTGDLLAANNLSELISSSGTVRGNLSICGALLTAETSADALARVASNPRGMFFVAGASMTNIPSGGAANDVFWGKGLDANNVTAFWLRQDGQIYTNSRVAGTWGGWIAQATQAFVTTAISTAQQLLHVQDRKTLNTAGGTFTAGSYLTRTLNSVRTNTISGASLSSNQITLPAGSYDIDATCPAYAVSRHKAQLYNVTDGATQVLGTAEFTAGVNTATTNSIVRGRFTIAAQKVFELRHRCETTSATNGFGVASNMSLEEIYTDALIRKVT